MSDIINSFHKKEYDISDDVKKFHAGLSSKASDTQTKLDIRTNEVNENAEQLTISNASGSCNHAK